MTWSPPVGADRRPMRGTGRRFIGKDGEFGFAVLFACRGSKNKRRHHKQKDRSAEKGNPEIDIVHLVFSSMHRTRRRPRCKGKANPDTANLGAEEDAFNTACSADWRGEGYVPLTGAEYR